MLSWGQVRQLKSPGNPACCRSRYKVSKYKINLQRVLGPVLLKSFLCLWSGTCAEGGCRAPTQHRPLHGPVTPPCAQRAWGCRDRVVWPVSLYPQLRSSPHTEGCSHALSDGWPSCGAPWEGSGISPPGRRSRETSPPPCSQPFPSSCPPTGEQKQPSTHSRLKRDNSGLDLATWHKNQKFLRTTDHVFSCQLPTCWKMKLYFVYMKQLKAFSKLAQPNCRTLCSALTASCTTEHFVNI